MVKSCLYCGNKFETKNERKIYCSNSCKTMNYRKVNGISEPDFLKPKNQTIGKAFEMVTKERQVQKQIENPKYVENYRIYETQLNEIELLQRRKSELITQRINLINRNEQAIGTALGIGVGLASKNILGVLAFGIAGNLIGKEVEKEREFEVLSKIQRIDDSIIDLDKRITASQMKAAFQYSLVKTISKKISQTVTESYTEKMPLVPLGSFQITKPEKIPLLIENDNKAESKTLISLSELKNMTFQTLDFTDEWKDIFNNPQGNFKMMIYGESGHGKSYFAAKFAEYLSNNFGKVLYNAAEEGLNKGLQMKMAQLDSKYMDIGHYGDFDKLKRAMKPYKFVIIDSVNEMNLKPNELKELFDMDKRRGIIYIMQVTKQGEFKGDNQFKHDADIIVRIENKTPVIEKNRFK